MADPIVQSPLIAIVDDDAAVCLALRFHLEMKGYRVACFKSAEEFLSRGMEMSPRVLIVDQLLPGMLGLDFVELVQARDLRTGAILISTRFPPKLAAAAHHAGVSMVEKPLIGSDLVDRIEGILAAEL